MLFSEPKIPQLTGRAVGDPRRERFQCSSASRKFLNPTRYAPSGALSPFQCSSASRKFLNLKRQTVKRVGRAGFSALQRAENSSMRGLFEAGTALLRFQCSSASRKFLNRRAGGSGVGDDARFSALQRAENSSMECAGGMATVRFWFQCSSASRKFLNPDPRTCVHPYFRPR